jgi:hypothetical protein
MAVGTPVVAIGLAAKIDFVTEETGYFVCYALLDLRKNIGHYRKGNLWPEIDKGRLVEGVKEAKSGTKGARAREIVAQGLGREAVGRVMVDRL